MKVYDFECLFCGTRLLNQLVDDEDKLICHKCSKYMTRLISAPKILTTIIPTYPGSQKHKAGYQHKHVNRPATKTQVGVGGGVTKGENT